MLALDRVVASKLGLVVLLVAWGLACPATGFAEDDPKPLFHEAFDAGEHEGVVGAAGQDMVVPAPGRIDMDRGTLAFFAKRINTKPYRWWTKPQYPAGDRHGFRRIGGVAQNLGEGYYFQGMGFEVWSDELMFLLLDAGRTSPPIRLGHVSEDWSVDTWRHFAVVWDHNEGITVYVDGKRVWSNWGKYQWQWSLFPSALFLNGVGDEFYVYADCLTDAQVAQLAGGKAPTGAPLAITPTDTRRDNERARYGWRPQDLDALPAVANGAALRLDFARFRRMAEWNRPQAQPRDGLNTTTWPQVYYGPAIKGQHLDIELADNATFDHARALIQRPFDGTLVVGDRRVPLETDTGTVWRRRFDEPISETGASLLRRQGQLGRLDFYRAQAIKVPAAHDADVTYALAPGSFPDSELGRTVATETPVRFHQPVMAQTDAPKTWTIDAPAFGGFQVFTPTPEGARAYDGVMITLVAESMSGPTPVRVVVKEPVHSRKDWLVTDVLLVPTGDGQQTFTLVVKGRPVINLPPLRVRSFKAKPDTPFEPVPGVAFGVTVTAGEPVTWVMGDDGSRVTFTTTDLDAALPEATDDQVEFMRQGFATVMEGHLYEDERIQIPLTWLARFAPQRKEFKQMARRARLRSVFEGYTEPESESHPAPANPRHAPDWALWQREAMQEIRRYVDWNIDTMQQYTGEFGSTFNDDTIKTEVWINYALMMDDSGKIAGALHRFYDGLYRYGLDRGVSRYITDSGHASEEGSSSIAMALMLDYGDPLTYERVLAAASHYDDWLEKTDTGYRAISAYAGGPGAWVHDEFVDAYGGAVHPLMIPAGYLIWYNRHPRAWDYLDGVIRQYDKYGHMDDFFTGARQWWTGNRPVDPGLNPKGKSKPYQPSTRPFRPFHARRLDDDPLWRAWRAGGDDRCLVDLYQRMVEWFDNYDWLITRAMPSADRIAEPTTGLIATRLGIKASDRGSAGLIWPEYAVSYTRGADDVAALVTDARLDHFAMRLFPFPDQPHDMQIRLWRLNPGTYDLTLATDRDDDGEGEDTIEQRQVEVKRGTFVDLTLPPGHPSVLTLTPVAVHEPDFTAPDPAISLDTIEVVYNRHLIVKVHNLGSTATHNVVVRVRDARTGDIIPRGEQRIESIEPALDFKPSYKAVQFDDIYAVTRGMIVEIESDGPDLNPWNNRVELTDANILGPDYIGIERRARH